MFSNFSCPNKINFPLHEIDGKARRKSRRSRRSGLCEGLRIPCGNCRISLATSLIDSLGRWLEKRSRNQFSPPRTFLSAAIYQILCLLRVTRVASKWRPSESINIWPTSDVNARQAACVTFFYQKSMHAASVNQICWHAYAHIYDARGSEWPEMLDLNYFKQLEATFNTNFVE